LAVVAIVATQIVNFWPINDGWRYAHDEIMLPMRFTEFRAAFRKRFPLALGRPLSAAEVNGLWAAWKRDRMEQYVRENGLSPGAAYLVFELREIDRQRGRGGGDDRDDR
jgi:hypothetical protein